MSLSSYFFFPVQLWRGSDGAALVGTWHPARVNPPHISREKCLCFLQEEITLVNIPMARLFAVESTEKSFRI